MPSIASPFNGTSEHPHYLFIQLINSGKARQNYQQNAADLRRTISNQKARSPFTDGFEFDPLADPRFVADCRNKRAKELAKLQPQTTNNETNDGINTITPFVRSENLAV